MTEAGLASNRTEPRKEIGRKENSHSLKGQKSTGRTQEQPGKIGSTAITRFKLLAEAAYGIGHQVQKQVQAKSAVKDLLV